MSISGIRTAYREAEIANAAELLAAMNNWQYVQDAIHALLAIEPPPSDRDTATC